MQSTEFSEFASVVKLVLDGGALVLLIWLVYQFRSGQIMPRSTVDNIIKTYEKWLEERRQAELKFYDDIINRLEEVATCPYYLYSDRDDRTSKS